MAKTRSLTIRLIKDSTKDNAIIKDATQLKLTKLKSDLPFSGWIYYRPSSTKPPAWVRFLDEGATTPLASVFSAQATALLIVKVGKQRFAISFGHAWQWIDESAIERRFGLLAALNCIEDDQIKVVDAQQIDSLALSKRAQISHSSEIMSFGLDVRRDLMRAIVGRPKSVDIGRSIMGADAIRIVCKVEFAELGNKCAQLLRLSKKKDYQTKYPWVDNIEIVKNPVEKEGLDNLLVEQINRLNAEGVYLSSPRIRDLNADEEYRFHFDKDPETRRFDLEIEDLMAGITKDLPITLQYLKKRKVEVYAGGSQTPVDTFSIYSGLVFETSRSSKLYCLIDSDWYQISKSHVDFVNDRIKKIAKSKIKFPPANKNEKEGDYNLRAAKALPGLCLDKKMISYGGGNSKIEVCDILTKAPCFIHVKRATGSQLLSHLFNQGVVAGQFLLEDEFRDKCKVQAKPPYNAIFGTPFSPEKIAITFAIISPKATGLPDNLPFFSKQTLINAADLLGKFKYRVDVAGISAK